MLPLAGVVLFNSVKKGSLSEGLKQTGNDATKCASSIINKAVSIFS